MLRQHRLLPIRSRLRRLFHVVGERDRLRHGGMSRRGRGEGQVARGVEGFGDDREQNEDEADAELPRRLRAHPADEER